MFAARGELISTIDNFMSFECTAARCHECFECAARGVQPAPKHPHPKVISDGINFLV
jgi:hypothetical protein